MYKKSIISIWRITYRDSSVYGFNSVAISQFKKEKFPTNGANCNSKNSLMIKAALFFGLSIIALYLLIEHSAHLLAYSSSILLFSFILLHVLMCGNHGKHGGMEEIQGKKDKQSKEHMEDAVGNTITVSISIGKQRKKTRTP